MKRTYFFTTPETEWVVLDSWIYESHKNPYRVNPRERKTWEALLILSDSRNRQIRLGADYWPGKQVKVWTSDTSEELSNGMRVAGLREAGPGRRNPESARDLAWVSLEQPTRETFGDAFGSELAYWDAMRAYDSELAGIRDHNRAFRPIRQAIESLIWDIERFSK